MANVVTERQIAKAAHDPGPARSPGSPLSAAPDTIPDPVPPSGVPATQKMFDPAANVREAVVTPEDLEAARGYLARVAGVDPKDVSRVTGIHLDDVEALKRYIRTAPPSVMSKAFGMMSSVEDKAAALLEAANRYLRAKGIPEMKLLSKKLGPGVGGYFDAEHWTMLINTDLLTDSMTTQDVAGMLFLSGHEARHAEQSFMMMRLKLADLPKEASEVQKLQHLRTEFPGLTPPEAAMRDAIKAGPLDAGADVAKVREWHKSMYVAGFREKRGAILDAWEKAEAAVAKAEANLAGADKMVEKAKAAKPAKSPGDPMYTFEQNQLYAQLRDAKQFQQRKAAELADAKTDLAPKKQAYKSLPEEADAYQFQYSLHGLDNAGAAPAGAGAPGR